MATRPRVLVDINVVLDVLQRREPYYLDSARVLAAAETGRIEACVAAHAVTILYYLIARGRPAEHARVLITDLLQIVGVATVDRPVIEQALNLPYRDFEDAVQMMAAVRAGMGYMVTRNPRDFRAGPLPALQPAELLAILA